MDTKKLYNDVYAKVKIGEAAFKRAFNGAVRYIVSRYGVKYATDNESSLYLDSVGDTSSLYDAYYSAVENYICSAFDTSEDKFVGFSALAEAAYRNVWKEKNKGKKIRGCSF